MIVTLLRVFILGLGAWLILHGHLTIGGLVAFMSLMGEVLSPGHRPDRHRPADPGLDRCPDAHQRGARCGPRGRRTRRPPRARTHPSQHRAARGRVLLHTRTPDARGRQRHHHGRTEGGLRRPHRGRQVLDPPAAHALLRARRGGSALRRGRLAPGDHRVIAGPARRRVPGDLSVQRDHPRQHRAGQAGCRRRRDRGGGASGRDARVRRVPARGATTPSSASVAGGSRAGRSSACPSPGRCCATPAFSCSTRRPRPSTHAPSASSPTPSSVWARAAPPSR